jgi:rod shape-determining protein MreD
MMQTRDAIARWMGYSVLLLISLILQIMVFPRVGAVPNPMLSVVAVVCAAVFTGTAGGAAAGFICGMICDALLGTEAYYSLMLLGAGAMTGALCGRVLQKKFLPAVILSALSVVLISAFHLLFYLAPVRGVPVGAFVSVGLPEIFMSVLSVTLIYPLFRAVSKLFSGD